MCNFLSRTLSILISFNPPSNFHTNVFAIPPIVSILGVLRNLLVIMHYISYAYPKAVERLDLRGRGGSCQTKGVRRIAHPQKLERGKLSNWRGANSYFTKKFLGAKLLIWRGDSPQHLFYSQGSYRLRKFRLNIVYYEGYKSILKVNEATWAFF